MNRIIVMCLMLVIPCTVFGNTLYFPQVAAGGRYQTTFVPMNMGNTSLTAQFSCYRQDGTPSGSGAGGVLLPANGSNRIVIPNTGSLTVQWCLVSTGGTIQGVATFQRRDNNGLTTPNPDDMTGALITTAGVLGIDAGNTLILPVAVTSTSSTGVAVANVNGTSPVNIALQLFSEAGTLFATANDVRLNPLGAHQQVADFITSFFPKLSGTSFHGTLVVSAAAGTSLNSLAVTALIVKEGLLSALPVVPYAPASTGTTGGSSGSGAASIGFALDLTGGSTIQFQGRTIITDTQAYFFDNLAPGTYQMTGTVGLDVYIYFSRVGVAGSGGVVPGSLKSLGGPSPLVSACNVFYINSAGSPQPFTLQFTVTNATNSACQ